MSRFLLFVLVAVIIWPVDTADAGWRRRCRRYCARLCDRGTMHVASNAPAAPYCRCVLPAEATVRASRPSSTNFWGAYLNYDKVSQPAVWNTIGGSIGEMHGPPNNNSCAARVSYGLNYGGALVQQFPAASVNLPDHTYMGKAGDGRRYVVSAMQMAAYLRHVWGAPDRQVTTAQQLQQTIDNLANGQCAIFATPNPPGGRGHAGVLKKGYTDPHVAGELPVDVWILP